MAAPPVVIARVVGVFGLNGAVKAEVLTDFVERFRVGAVFDLGGEERTIASVNWHKSQVRLKFEGVDTVDAAKALVGKVIECKDAKRPVLDADEFLYSDLIGMSAYTESGELLGTVDSVSRSPGQDLIHIGSLLIPAAKAFVRKVSIVDRTITVRLIPGMLNDADAEEVRTS